MRWEDPGRSGIGVGDPEFSFRHTNYKTPTSLTSKQRYQEVRYMWSWEFRGEICAGAKELMLGAIMLNELIPSIYISLTTSRFSFTALRWSTVHQYQKWRVYTTRCCIRGADLNLFCNSPGFGSDLGGRLKILKAFSTACGYQSK